jgi:DNA invertase Pin-like site-specific DNA recombinase
LVRQVLPERRSALGRQLARQVWPARLDKLAHLVADRLNAAAALDEYRCPSAILLDRSGGFLYCFPQESVRKQAKPMAKKTKTVQAVAYLRTSSAATVGNDKDSDKRQRAAITAFAKANGYQIVDEFYDAAVSGADPIDVRPGFKAMLDRIAGNGVRVIIVESPDRFARDLTVQLTGHDFLKSLGITLVPATAPEFFTEDTPTAVLVRQVLGAIAQFEKASLVAKLKAARDRKKAATGKCGGRFSYAERDVELVAKAKELSKQRPRLSLREIAGELARLGKTTPRGLPFSASAVASMLRS